MQERGVRVISRGRRLRGRPKVIGDLEDAGPVDVVFLGVKAHSLTQLAPQLPPLLGPEHHGGQHAERRALVVFPDWAGEFDGMHLERVDPGGVIAAAIEPRRVLGSLVYFATEIVEPGVIHHTEGNRISLGEPDGTRSERCRRIAEALIAAGFRCPVTHAHPRTKSG